MVAAIGAAGLGMGAAMGYAWAAFAFAPRLTEVVVRPCAIPAERTSFAVALEALVAVEAGLPIRIGPLQTEGTRDSPYLHFDPSTDGS